MTHTTYAGLHVLADDDPRWAHDPVAQARAACSGGAGVVQLRAKHAGDRQILDWAREIRALTRDAGLAFVMNDRFDLALLAEADGVHLGQGDLAPRDLPAEARERLALGRSTHDLGQLEAALADPLAYVAFGPVFETRSKAAADPARGLDRLRQAADACDGRPLVAIGGIDGDNVAGVAAAGARGVAVIRTVADAQDPAAVVGALVSRLDAACGDSAG